MKKSVLLICFSLLFVGLNSVQAGYSRAPDRDVGQHYESVSVQTHDFIFTSNNTGQELLTAVVLPGEAVTLPAPQETTGYNAAANEKPIAPALKRKIYLLNCSIRQC